jgi:hypothetical protein
MMLGVRRGLLPSKPVDLPAEPEMSFEQLNTWLNTLEPGPKVDARRLPDRDRHWPTFDPAGRVICRSPQRAWPDRNSVR